MPVNWTNITLQSSKVQHSDIDKLSISNIPVGSKRLVPDNFSVLKYSNIPDRLLQTQFKIVSMGLVQMVSGMMIALTFFPHLGLGKS